MHCAKVFVIPTTQVPVMVLDLQKRGDVAEIWYLANREPVFDVKNAYKRWSL
jgi:hypothetical protein